MFPQQQDCGIKSAKEFKKNLILPKDGGLMAAGLKARLSLNLT